MAEAQGLPDLSARRSRLLGSSDRRGLVLSTASTVVVLAAVLAVFLLAPGSRQVRHTFFNPTDMWRAFVGNPGAGYYSVGEALWLNIRMFVAAEILILILALVVAVVRQSTGPVLLPLRLVGTVYVDVARGVPLILIIFAIGFGVPALEIKGISSQSAAVYGVAALVFSYSAYVSEVYRAGLSSVHRSQAAAARSLGMSGGPRCVTSSCRRPSGSSSRRCSTTSSACRRTPRWSACWARSRPTRRPNCTATRCSTTRATRWPRSCSCC